MAMFHLDQPNILGICEHSEYFQSFSYLNFSKKKNEMRKEKKYMVVQFLAGLELPR